MVVLRAIVLPLVALLGLCPARAAVERVLERSFNVSPGVTLVLQTFQGSIRVNTADTDRARVVVYQTVDATTEAEADQRLKSMILSFTEAEGSLSIEARPARSWRWAWEKWPPVGLRFDITLPRACRLDLATREGDIIVGAVEGAVRVRTEAGTIFVGEVDGTIHASSERGDVAVTACSGELTVIAKMGNVLVGRAGGLCSLEGSGGSIEVQQARGPVHASASVADIKIGFTHPLGDGSALKASGGDIVLSFDPRSASTLDLRASTFGDVRVRDLPIEVTNGKVGSSRVFGTMHGGGATVTAIASGGNIRVSARDPLP